MSPRFRSLALGVGLAGLLAGGIAVAQQPQPNQPRPMPQPLPGRPPGPGGLQRVPGLPGGHPGVPGMPGGRLGPDGRPMPGGRAPHGGLPPGFNPNKPVAKPAHAEHEEEGGHGGHEVCPGHGPDDPPPPPNWWRGLVMVNNERAQQPDFLNQLLFRYEDPQHPCDPKNQPPPFLATVINFGVLAWVFFKFGKKPIGEALVKRKQTIMADIDAATKLKEDAEARLEDYEEKLDNLAETLKEVRAEFAAQAEAEKKHVLAEAEERKIRMRRDAEFRIEQELKTARTELLREAVANAVVAAEQLVVNRVKPSDLDRMADDYLKSIGPALSGKKSIAGDRA